MTVDKAPAARARTCLRAWCQFLSFFSGAPVREKYGYFDVLVSTMLGVDVDWIVGKRTGSKAKCS